MEIRLSIELAGLKKPLDTVTLSSEGTRIQRSPREGGSAGTRRCRGISTIGEDSPQLPNGANRFEGFGQRLVGPGMPGKRYPSTPRFRGPVGPFGRVARARPDTP